jgi:GT2 family glycosyltransferase
MLARMEGDARVGAVGPRLVYGDGRWQRWTAGRAPTLWTALTYFLFLERLFPGWPAFRSMYLGQDLRRAFAADWVCSACMLLRRAALDQVGLLDERLFVYMDDVELCQRLRAGGWSVWYCPEGEAVHFGSQSTPGSIAAGSSRALRAFKAYFARHHGPAATLALRGVEAVGFGLRVLAYGIAARASSPAASARLSASARAHWVHLKATKEMNA